MATSGVRLCPPSLAAESERGRVFVAGNLNDSDSESSCGVRLYERVRRCRVDPINDDIHRHSGIPFLDMSQQHSARRVAGIGLGLRWCPIMDRRRELGATDELRLGSQVDQGKIAGGKRVAMSLVATNPPHLRLEKTSGLWSVAVGELNR
jgi:hypothetical protein